MTKLFAGSYTKWITPGFGGQGEGLYIMDFDPETGEIKTSETYPLVNPSYLTVFDNTLYTFNEISLEETPLLYAFKINLNGQLELLNSVPINGSYPCHITYSREHKSIFISCYGSGNILIYPINNDGSVGPEMHNIQHRGNSQNSLRQEMPHVHFVGISGNNEKMFVADLGIDKIMIYALEGEAGLCVSLISYIRMPGGSGPRHLAFHPDGKFLFVLAELTAEIFLIDLYARKIITSLPLLSETVDLLPSAAAIKISDDGRYIYVSERTTNKIFVLKFDNKQETIEWIHETEAHVITPRDFLLDSLGKWLIIAGQDSDSLSVFKRDVVRGTIMFYKTHKNFKSISCLILI